MASFIGNRVKKQTDINDEVLVNNMIASSAAAAQAYLGATVATVTPELRAMYAAGLNQIVGENTAYMELAVKKGWEKPYSSPTEQLSDAYNKSKSTVDTM